MAFEVAADTVAEVGALGTVLFKKGFYVYIGSAQNGIEQRVQRHMKKQKRLRWHIDYLLGNDAAKIVNVFYKEAGRIEECNLAKEIGKNAEPVPGFGCSDCRCTSHLFRVHDFGFVHDSMKRFSAPEKWVKEASHNGTNYRLKSGGQLSCE